MLKILSHMFGECAHSVSHQWEIASPSDFHCCLLFSRVIRKQTVQQLGTMCKGMQQYTEIMLEALQKDLTRLRDVFADTR